MQPQLRDFLESIKDQWLNPTNNDNDGLYEKVPDGKYKCQLSDANFQVSKKGNFMLVWTHKIIEGELDGRTHRDYLTLTHEFKIREVSERFQKFGIQPDYDTDNFSEDINESLENLCVRAPIYTAEFRYKPNKDPNLDGWMNVKILQLDEDYELDPTNEIDFQVGDNVSTYIDSEDGSGNTQTIEGAIESFQSDNGVRSAIIIDKKGQRYSINPTALTPSSEVTDSEAVTILCESYNIGGSTLELKRRNLQAVNWSEKSLRPGEKILLSKIGIS